MIQATKKLMLKLLLISILSLMLSSCGFHLRGQHVLPPELHCIRLQSLTPYGDFESILRRYLSQLGLIVTRTSCAPITIHILSTNLFHDVPTIGGSNQARVYVYYYQVYFQILDSNQQVLICPKTIVTSGTLIVNAGTALEATNQLEVLRQELQVEATHMIINVLNSPQVSCALSNR